jgi:hypothetical protein
VNWKKTRTISDKNLLTLIGVVMFLIGISLGRIYYDLHKYSPRALAEREFAGIVIDIGTSTFSVKNFPGEVKIFEVATSTDIVKGKERISYAELTVGELVIISRDTTDKSKNIAAKISVLKKKNLHGFN